MKTTKTDIAAMLRDFVVIPDGEEFALIHNEHGWWCKWGARSTRYYATPTEAVFNAMAMIVGDGGREDIP